jgi:hypothetical protein
MLPGSDSESPAIGPGERKYTLELKVKSWSSRRKPFIRTNTVIADEKFRIGSDIWFQPFVGHRTDEVRRLI